ncbi:MAG: 16S rRNA (guanine(966)-N(2))-methyltransferase RsmD [Candidatus Aminicenantes bacterium]|nr:MAG: 16S rRNA (guanine(966)-N(2))-methyltransferase RsmD [Candidatus Aminicenantes bacterium]
MIRVISGQYKGKRLRRVPSDLVRPMPDKLKEALYNILHDDVKDSFFLDAYAGTGSVGIEALSRRAELAVFVDDYYPSIKVIKANLVKCGAEDKARIMHKEFNRAVIQLSKEGAKFNLIFLDPPYKMLEERNPLKVIKKREILAKEGRVILRHFYKMKFDGKYFDLERSVTLGDDTLQFYR